MQRPGGEGDNMKSEMRGGFYGAIIVTACLLTFFAPSCSTVNEEQQGADETIRFHNWWNFYERGIGRLKAENWTAAQEDFERCLDLRSGARFGNSKDVLRVRTYGVHMLENYFPNRELGICLFMLGRAGDSIPHLEKSLKQEPSSRAKYYLNLAHKTLLSAGAVPRPQILLATENKPGWTRDREKIVSGSVHADGRVNDLDINGDREFIELAETERKFNRAVSLASGLNRIKIVVRDLIGQSDEKTIEWLVDWRKPSLTILSVKPENNGWKISGIVDDDQMLRSARIDGREVPAGAQSNRIAVAWTLEHGMNSVITAEDMAGNILTAKVSSADLSVAWADRNGWQFADAGAAALPKKASADMKPPTLNLSANTEGAIYVNHNRFYLDGSARDMGGLREISVLGEPYLRDDETGCIEKHFSTLFDLKPGTNSFWITATDMSGNCASQQVVVVRLMDEFLSDEYRMTVAVPPLLNPDHDPMAVKAHREINGHVMKEPKRFRLLERNEGWDAILQEHQLSASGLVRQDLQIKVGKMLPAELLFLGEFLREGKGVTLRVNVVESGKGETLFSDDIYTEQPDREVAEKSAGLVLKIKQHMPMMKGRIVSVNGDRIVVDIGTEQGLLAASQFVVARTPSEERAGANAAVLCRVGEQWIRLHVEDMETRRAVTSALPEKAGKLLKPGDIVFAR